ncbi:hypothetical protein AB0P40_43515, partial [Streptomyces sp. NPDC079189]
PDGDWLNNLELRVHVPEGIGDFTRTVTVPDLTGAPAATYEVVREGNSVRVTTDTDRPYEVTVVGESGLKVVKA